MRLFPKIIFVFCLLIVPTYMGFPEENNSLPDIKTFQNAIIQTVNRLQPALVKIHAVEKYYSEGREQKQEKFGSGMVISKDGYVVTNHHVAGKAYFADCTFINLKNYPLNLIGTDPLTDICVLKIITDEPVEFVYGEFGDSDAINVGDYVLAMGSPMSINPSVTLGIISTKRLILPYKLNSFEMFSEDGENVGSLVCWLGHNAEISPGNSGGPLVNLKGEIIGINEIKYALGGAIPSNLAKKVVNDLIQYGKVKRSWVGVEVQPITFENKMDKGSLIRYVYPDSPAERAGLKTGDILLQIGDEPIQVKYMEQIPIVNNILCSLPINEPVIFKILRDGNQIDISLKPDLYDFPETEERELKEWGFTAKNLNWFFALNKKRNDTNGVLITSLRAGGNSAQAKPSLQKGDVILEVENEEIHSLDDLQRKTRELLDKKIDKVLVIAERNKNKIYSLVKITESHDVEPVREASKPWIGVEVQVLTKEIAEKKNIESGGFIITRIYPVQEKGLNELQVGDVIIEIENEKLYANKVEDYEEWKERIRNYSIGQEITLSIFRENQTMQIPIQLIREPIQRNMTEKYQDDWLEFTVRDLCFYDWIDLNIREEISGVFVEQVVSGGWASLAKLEQGDIILSVESEPVKNINDFKEKISKLKEQKINRFVFETLRGIQRYFVKVEIK